MSRVRIAVSVTAEAAARLVHDGPRRDFLALAAEAAGEVVYQPSPGRRSGLLPKLFGPHLRLAWGLARTTSASDVTFLDGEHLAIPYLASAALLRRRPERTVFLGHLLTKRWKLALLWLTTRIGGNGTLIVHSVEQQAAARRYLGPRWRIVLMPYQVDTAFWTAPLSNPLARPRVLAVGSESRDYDILVRAVDGLECDVTIAAGSHWARSTARAASLPGNVTYLSEPLPFAGLRELYRQADVVVVPLHDVANQSGITTMLEAMSCGRPVIVTASRGQRECLRGPLMRADGTLDAAATEDRGPHHFDASAAHPGSTGLYVPAGDAPALRHAISRLCDCRGEAAAMGGCGRAAAETHFTTGRFAAAIARELRAVESAGKPIVAGAVAR